MKRITKHVFGFVLVLLLGSALAQSDSGAMNADALKWGPAPDAFMPGAELAVLDGDPSQAVRITLRLKMPAGYEIAAHWHPTQEDVTVLSGSLNVGMGDVLDKNAATTLLTVGGFVPLGADMNHFVWTDEETIIQIHMDGPFEINYVDPQMDPRNQ